MQIVPEYAMTNANFMSTNIKDLYINVQAALQYAMTNAKQSEHNFMNT